MHTLRPWEPPPNTSPILPATRLTRNEKRGGLQCAAYKATCVPGSFPPRAVLSLASGVGGIGLGVPAANGGWILRDIDFCKGPPRELKTRVSFGEKYPRAEDCICPTSSLDARSKDPLGFGRWIPAGGLPKVPRPNGPWPSRCDANGGRSFITYQCSRRLLVPQSGAPSSSSSSRLLGHATELLRATTLPPPARRRQTSSSSDPNGGVDVLLATSDHFGHGVFALVQRVLNQIHYANSLDLVPAVFLGERTFMEPQACEYGPNPYHHTPSGDNVWEYWFTQPSNYSIGAATVNGVQVRSVQMTTVEASADAPVRAYGVDRVRRRSRHAANRMLGDGGSKLVKSWIREMADNTFAPWRARSDHIIGVHMRGTDKVMRPKVPPQAYYPFIDAYLKAHPDGLVFVATDDRRYANRLGGRYGWSTTGKGSDDNGGKLVGAGRGYADASWGGNADPAVRGHNGGGGMRKGVEVILDALLLSKCDYVLISASGVAEFALWVSPHLWTHHLDLQAVDRFALQALPAWSRYIQGVEQAIASGVPGGRRRAVADHFCGALAAACANETGKLRSGPRYCSRCKTEEEMKAEKEREERRVMLEERERQQQEKVEKERRQRQRRARLGNAVYRAPGLE